MTISKQIQRMLGDEDGTRACCHETGHAVVALHLGFKVKCIGLVRGFSRTICEDFDLREGEDRFIVLAGGIAAEERFYDDGVDKEASARDQEMISERKGNEIGTYVPKAKKIIEANMQRFKLLRKTLVGKWRVHVEDSAFDKALSFELLSSSELEEIWPESKQAN